MPAILKNADQFDRFYQIRFRRSRGVYTSENFQDIVGQEKLDGFICGSDTIFCIDEFGGFEDGYYANYPCMQGRSVSYAASFGDARFTPDTLAVLRERLQNFQSLGLREDTLLPFVRESVSVPVKRVLDPTLLLTAEDYEPITAARREARPYLLLYARRHNPQMSAYAEKIAAENGWEIVEISLRAENAQRHRMFYEAGVEDFLSLVKYAEYVVTNSYHGMIFSVQFHKNFLVFFREQCASKIKEVLELMGLPQRLVKSTTENVPADICYPVVDSKLKAERLRSLNFLTQELETLL